MIPYTNDQGLRAYRAHVARSQPTSTCATWILTTALTLGGLVVAGVVLWAQPAITSAFAAGFVAGVLAVDR